jgi:hypothetical protein
MNQRDKGRRRIGAVDFENATLTIAYEMYHFRFLAQLYRDGQAGGGLWFQLWAQSMLLHLRIMIEFFYGKGPNSQDVTIRSFLELPGFAFPTQLYSSQPRIYLSSNARGRPESMTMNEVKKALNERLVHFGTGRWTDYHPGHEDYERCYDELETRIIAFRNALPEPHRSTFDHRLRELEARDKQATKSIPGGPALHW